MVRWGFESFALRGVRSQGVFLFSFLLGFFLDKYLVFISAYQVWYDACSILLHISLDPETR